MTASTAPSTATARVQPKLHLVPWDASSDAHICRMESQRDGCGWDTAAVPKWAGKVLKGNKFMYWLVLDNDKQGQDDDLVAKHLKLNPQESEPIQDTATTLGGSPLTPSGASFVPIGHVAVDRYPDRNVVFGFDQGTIWIKSLYISRALHVFGLGRAAMRETERITTLPPLNATGLALDTVSHETQASEQGLWFNFDRMGLPRPAKFRTNQEWYAGMNYVVVPVPESVTEDDDEDSPVFRSYRKEINGDTAKATDDPELAFPTVWMYKALTV